MNQPLFDTGKIFAIEDDLSFEEMALNIFRFQYSYCDFYNQFCTARGVSPADVDNVAQIPFLPIQFFKTKRIITRGMKEQLIFGSSGTTGTQRSLHLVADARVYEQSFTTCYRKFFGDPRDTTILALLPSYIERNDSSLIHMTKSLISQTGNPDSGFYSLNDNILEKKLRQLDAAGKHTILLGVSFALLDFASAHSFSLNHCTVIETGGMKGRGEELTREDLHSRLKEKLGVHHIYSEYGMTELLSQAYMTSNGRFSCPPWMKILTRDTCDPLSYTRPGITGGINVADLANIYSCSFIETEDLGKLYTDGTFDVLGRLDKSGIRGCNLLSV